MKVYVQIKTIPFSRFPGYKDCVCARVHCVCVVCDEKGWRAWSWGTYVLFYLI